MNNKISGSSDFLSPDERILVLSPHADDEVYGCGGYLLKARNARASIHIVYFHIGDVCYLKGTLPGLVFGETRVDEVKKVAKVLQASFDILYTEPEQGFFLDTLSRRELLAKIEAVFNSFKPTQVLIPSPSFNQDHEAVYKVGLTACRPPSWKGGMVIKKVLVYNSHNIEWENNSFQPNFFLDISDVMEERNNLIKLYRSQLRDGSYLSIEHLEDYNQCLGREYLLKYAEGYELKRLVL